MEGVEVDRRAEALSGLSGFLATSVAEGNKSGEAPLACVGGGFGAVVGQDSGLPFFVKPAACGNGTAYEGLSSRF